MVSRSTSVDLVVVGGGINGAGIAADAAGRGLTVLLAEQSDLASGTSSASSKLIHGGLRYLEQFEFRLVREALAEREVLLAKAPHIIWPLRFVLPETPAHRSRLLLRLGLLIYDHLSRRRTLPRSKPVDLRRDPMGAALRQGLMRGFAYWDCWVDDARLVVLNARAAADRGAEILTRTRVTSLRRGPADWCVELRRDGRESEVRAKAVVNAAGPWVMDAAINPAGEKNLQSPGLRHTTPAVRLVKGSHIVVPRVTGAGDAFIFQHDDGRVVFALPFAGRFTLIGTTDLPFSGDPASAAASEGEIAYLLELANAYFAKPLSRGEVVCSFAGVRPLYGDQSADPSAVTRDYRLEIDAPSGAPPLLTVFGGKITTYRRLAEHALNMLRPAFPSMGPAWTAGAPLPGGDLGGDFEAFLKELLARHPHIQPETMRALARRHGTLAEQVIGDARGEAGLGEVLVKGGAEGNLTAREVVHMAAAEWASTPADILWRRTKTGLLTLPDERERISSRIAAYM